jgi:hypothetical protein
LKAGRLVFNKTSRTKFVIEADLNAKLLNRIKASIFSTVKKVFSPKEGVADFPALLVLTIRYIIVSIFDINIRFS